MQNILKETTMKNIFLAAIVLGGSLLTACNPNEDIYNKLDDAKKPYSEQNVPYTLLDADYSLAGNATVTANKAFSNTEGADTLIPKILAKKFLALKLNSTMDITYNYISRNVATDPNVRFGYELTDADYQSFGNAYVSANKSFNSANKSTDLLPAFLLAKYPTSAVNDTQNVVCKFNFAYNLERYVYNGTTWSRLNYTSDFSKIGYTVVPSDFYLMGISGAADPYFSATLSPDAYIPNFLKVKYPFAVTNAVKFVKYKFANVNDYRVDQYKYNGTAWLKVLKTDKFIVSSTGWIYDPAIRFIMNASDYSYILSQDTKHKDDKNGFEYGSSSQYNNISFNTYDWTTTNAKFVPNMFEGLTEAQITAKIAQQVQKGLILLLQHNYPAAQPLVKGVDSFYFVTFTAYKGTAPTMTYKFQCTAAGSPATFVFVEAVQ